MTDNKNHGLGDLQFPTQKQSLRILTQQQSLRILSKRKLHSVLSALLFRHFAPCLYAVLRFHSYSAVVTALVAQATKTYSYLPARPRRFAQHKRSLSRWGLSLHAYTDNIHHGTAPEPDEFRPLVVDAIRTGRSCARSRSAN
jgi:hypothetical protein